MIGVGELTTYWSGVPSMGRSCGAPSNTGVNIGPFTRGTVAVCGMEFAMTASCACGVPATAASTTPAGESGGMRRKSAGRLVLGTIRPRAPSASRRAIPAPGQEHVVDARSPSSKITSACVFVAQLRLVPGDGREGGLALEDDELGGVWLT